MNDVPGWLSDSNIFQFVTDFINSLIIASDILEARENFKNNRHILEKMLMYIFDQGKETCDDSL